MPDWVLGGADAPAAQLPEAPRAEVVPVDGATLITVLPKIDRGVSPSEAAALLPAAWCDERAATQTNTLAQG